MTTLTSSSGLVIRPAAEADHEPIWQIFRGAVAPGDAFVFEPETPRGVALAYWFQPGAHVYVAEKDGRIVGSCLIKPNQPALGAHIANGAFMVSPEARGLRVGRALGEHALAEARRLGFRGMQYNYVVSTNEPAVKLWLQLGFRIIGTVPGAFRHAQLGFVDVNIMFRELVEPESDGLSKRG